MKYVLSQDVLREGKITFSSIEDYADVPLAKVLMELEHVTQVHFFENVITITQKDTGSLGQIVMDTIRAHMDGHDPEFNRKQEQERQSGREDLSPEMQRIEAILDEKIRPALQMDGGDLDVLSYDKDTHRLLVSYQGACGGCPSAAGGTLMAIQGILCDEFDPDVKVIAEEAGMPQL